MNSQKSFALLILVACASRHQGASFDWARFEAPLVEDRPWVRWWWPGGDVDDRELEREIALLAEAGFGGAEVQALDAALDPNAPKEEIARRKSYGSSEFWGHLKQAARVAGEKGLSLDLTLGSGWPAGGPFVSPERSIRTLVVTERRVRGPGSVQLDLSIPDRPFFYDVAGLAEAMGERMARYRPELASLVVVLAAKVLSGERDSNPAVLTDTLVLDPASITVLTDLVGPDGVLTWDCPAGDFVVMAFHSIPTGEYVSLDAYPKEAWVADHLDAEEVDRTLDALLGPMSKDGVFHGFFSDSLEFKAERLFTDDFIAEFTRRRGYDPTPYLPVVMKPGADNFIFSGGGFRVEAPYSFGPDDERVRYDWDLTISDLFRERFLRRAMAYARAAGLKFRAQNYGMALDVIGSARDVDIPEAEQLYAGGADIFLKLVSSGAHLYGKPIVSAESFVWQGRDHASTPLKLKVAADKAFLDGINLLVFHGFPYRKTKMPYGELGWHPFSSPFSGAGTYSTTVGEGDPFWPYMPVLNHYLARVQYVLSSGQSQADLLVYWPYLGVPGAISFLKMEDEFLFNGRFDGEPEVGSMGASIVTEFMGGLDMRGAIRWVSSVWPVLRQLWDMGWTFDFANDESLAEVRPKGRGLEVRGQSYKAVLLLEAPFLDGQAAKALIGLASNGVPVLVTGIGPTRQPGMASDKDMVVKELVQQVGTIHLDSVAKRLHQASLRPTVVGAKRPVTRRLAGGGLAVFLANQTPDQVSWQLDVEGGCKESLLADPMTCAVWPGDLTVNLQPYGTLILFCNVELPKGTGPAPVVSEGVREVLGPWQLEVGDGVSMPLDTLMDFREVEGLKFTAEKATYRTTWHCEEVPSQAFFEVDIVHGTAEVLVNGKSAGTLVFPPWRVAIGNLLQRGDNEVKVVLTPPLRNGLIGRARAGDPTVRQFVGKEDTLVPVGLAGEARVTKVPQAAGVVSARNLGARGP